MIYLGSSELAPALPHMHRERQFIKNQDIAARLRTLYLALDPKPLSVIPWLQFVRLSG